MSRKQIEVVRQPLVVAARPRRGPYEQLVRFPRIVVLLARVIWRCYLWLPPRSRLRQAIARYYARLIFEALNRRDLEVAFALAHPNIESIFDDKLVALGFAPVSRGVEARLDAQRLWMAEWGEIRIELEELFDLGDGRFLILTHLKGSGLSSGAAVDTECAFLLTISAGLGIHEQVFLDHGEALEAVGVR